MLKLLRKKGVAKKVLWFVAIIIIISFGFFGTANYYQGGNELSHAGKIFGKRISFDEFQKSLLHARNQAILRYGDQFDKISQMLNLDSEAWDRLILLHEAKKRRIKILDEEVIDTIEDFEFFKQNGKFDPVMYNKIVRYVFRCEPRDFEEGVRESLIFSKLFEQETTPITATEEGALKEYQRRNEQIQVSYILFSADESKKEITLSPQETQEYYEQHKDDFRLPPAINIQYVTIEPPQRPQTTTPSETQQPQSPPPDAEMLAQNISDELQKTPDFEGVAKKFNLAVKESGFFNFENFDINLGLPFEVLQAALSLPENQISVPIKTSKGYYLIKIKEKKDAHLPSFEESNQKVMETLATQKARALAKQKASKFLDQAKQGLKSDLSAHFTQIAKNLNLKVEQTPLFIRNQYLPNIGISKDFQETAFSLTKDNATSDAVEITKGFCIIHLDQYVPIDSEKFAKEKDTLIKELTTSRKNETFNNFVLTLREKANLKDNIAKLREGQRVSP